MLKIGKIARLTPDIIDRYKPEKKEIFPNEKIEKIDIPNSFDNEILYKVTRRDIDLNSHMHNLYYLDLAYEVLPEEIYNKRPFDNIRITYKKEIKLGDVIKCKYKKEGNKNIVIITDQDDKIVYSAISLE